MRIKGGLRLEPYKVLNQNFTQVANSMFEYIEDVYAYKIYVYLCHRYNSDNEYAFPSINTIAKDCKISRGKVQNSLKYLEERRFIVKFKRKNSEYMNNCYYINYVVEDKNRREREQEKIIETIEKSLDYTIPFTIDEDGNYVFEEEIELKEYDENENKNN